MENKLVIEIVKNRDGSYYANVTMNNEWVKGLPEYVSYRTLRSAVKEKTGFTLPSVKTLHFETISRKKYANINKN